MSTVYRATVKNADQEVALKFLAPRLSNNSAIRRRFEDEERVLSACDHPNILSGINGLSDTSAADPYIVTTFVSGNDFSRVQKYHGNSTVLVLVRYCRILENTAKALAYVHQLDIVHRDIKPENILVPSNGEASQLCDFGLVCRTGERSVKTVRSVQRVHVFGEENISISHFPIGTPNYAPPERIKGADVRYPEDVWSLGIVAYEVLTGKKPFNGRNSDQICRNVTTSPMPRPPSQENSVLGGTRADKLIMEQVLLRERPTKRLTASQMAEEFNGLVSELERIAE